MNVLMINYAICVCDFGVEYVKYVWTAASLIETKMYLHNKYEYIY